MTNTKTENTENAPLTRVDAIKEFGLVDSDLVAMAKFFGDTTIKHLIKNLEYTLKYANLYNQVKVDNKRTDTKEIMSTLIGIDIDTLFNKTDLGAIGNLGALDKATQTKLTKKFVKDKKRLTSPRAILAWFLNKKKEVKTDLEKILATLKTLETLVNKKELKLKKADKENVNSKLAEIVKAEKIAIKSDK